MGSVQDNVSLALACTQVQEIGQQLIIQIIWEGLQGLLLEIRRLLREKVIEGERIICMVKINKFHLGQRSNGSISICSNCILWGGESFLGQKAAQK